MVFWTCDICGKKTHVHPETKPVLDKDGKQKVGFQFVQNPSNGKVIKKKIPIFEDLKPRAYIVRICLGNENITRDFCKECLDKSVLEKAKPFWEFMLNLESK